MYTFKRDIVGAFLFDNQNVFFASCQHTGISELTYPHIRYISSRMTGFGRTYEVRTSIDHFLGSLSWFGPWPLKGRSGPLLFWNTCGVIWVKDLFSFQDLLHLEERLGTVNRGASQGTIERCTYPHKYKKVSLYGCSLTLHIVTDSILYVVVNVCYS